MEIFATIIANEEQKMDFEKDLARNNILLRVMTPDSGELHYLLEGDWYAYEELSKNVGVYSGDHYTITSLEHSQE